MRRLVPAFLTCAISIALGAAGHMAPPHYATFDNTQKAALTRISLYLNSVRSLKGGFVQVDPDGTVEEGEFYLEKPGRMRFEYRPPTPTLIVSDGRTVAVKNSKLNTVDRYPLSDTPLDLILGDSIDLEHNLSVTGFAESEGEWIVHARSASTRSQGDIAITFSAEPLELRQWTVVDSQGLSTTVALRNLEAGVTLPGSLFVLSDPKSPFARKSEE
jgi:outer membrane lipoprotein-sorting protein